MLVCGVIRYIFYLCAFENTFNRTQTIKKKLHVRHLNGDGFALLVTWSIYVEETVET